MAKLIGAFIPLIGGLFGIAQFFVLNPIILIYVGYNAVKKFNADLAGGVVAGLVTGLVAGIIDTILSVLFGLLGLGIAANSTGVTTETTALIGGVGMIAIIIGGILYTVALTLGGAVCALVGAAIANRK